jgi:hypothetical protein
MSTKKLDGKSKLTKTTTTTTREKISSTTNNMTSQFEAPHCLRANLVRGQILKDFYFVNVGLLVVRHATKTLEIYDKEDLNNPQLIVNLTDVDHMELRIVVSEHTNHRLGRFRLFGHFGRPTEERLTIKMELGEFRRLQTLLVDMNL